MQVLEREFPIPFDDDLTRMATFAIFLGSLLVRLAQWTTIGWVVVVLGVVTLWMAHHLAVAPYIEEPAS
jgi:hypothetical protein